MTRVMVFGTFDGLHAGHRSLFKQARMYGDILVAVVARDEVVLDLKGRMPTRPLGERIEHLVREDHVDKAVPSDTVMGSWAVIRKYKPDVIACGYDQHELRKDLEKSIGDFPWQPRLVVLQPFDPQKYHTSILKG